MKFYIRAVLALGAAVTLAAQCRAQVLQEVPAPAPLPPCLIHYYDSNLGNSEIRLILYKSDQTYVEIYDYYGSLLPLGTAAPQRGTTTAPQSGTYTYTVDPQNSAHATITYTGGNLGADQLYFYAPNSGVQSSSLVIGGFISAFTVYPQQSTNGGTNMSNRCQLATGSAGITGFVVQSGAPRWVLLRTVGTSLGSFGVTPTVSSPSFTLYDSSQTVVGTSSVWSGDPNLVGGYEIVFSMVGAFPLKGGSDEGVLLVPLNPGAYTAMYQAGGTGTILCEAYILPF